MNPVEVEFKTGVINITPFFGVMNGGHHMMSEQKTQHRGILSAKKEALVSQEHRIASIPSAQPSDPLRVAKAKKPRVKLVG
jgi:hypothetical protein